MINTTNFITSSKINSRFSNKVETALSLPGTASNFIPNSGTPKACKTSFDVIKNLKVWFIGTIKDY